MASTLITLIVPQSEVGVVSCLRSQAVVEVLTPLWVILVNCTHCLNQLWDARTKQSGSSPATETPLKELHSNSESQFSV